MMPDPRMTRIYSDLLDFPADDATPLVDEHADHYWKGRPDDCEKCWAEAEEESAGQGWTPR